MISDIDTTNILILLIPIASIGFHVTLHYGKIKQIFINNIKLFLFILLSVLYYYILFLIIP